MKTASQVREYVRRRWLQTSRGPGAARPAFRAQALAYLEILYAFDTPHKSKLEMPPVRFNSSLKSLPSVKSVVRKK